MTCVIYFHKKKDITSNELRSNRLHIVYFGNTNCKLKTFKFHSCVVLEFGHFIYSYLLFHFFVYQSSALKTRTCNVVVDITIIEKWKKLTAM